MSSVAVQVAKAVANELNTVPFAWPNPTFNGVDNTANHLMTTYVEAAAKVAPLVRRTEIGELKVFTAPPQDTRSEADGRDRCDRRHQYSINVLVIKRLDEEDADEIQPAHLDEISSLMGFNEAVLDFWDNNRSIQFGERGATLVRVSQIAYDEEMLKQSNVYMGMTTIVLRVN